MISSSCIHFYENDMSWFFIMAKKNPLCIHTTYSLSSVAEYQDWCHESITVNYGAVNMDVHMPVILTWSSLAKYPGVV